MQVQILQIAVQANHWMQLPYIRALTELDAVSNSKHHSFTVPNSILQLKIGDNIKVYNKLKDKVRKLLIDSIADNFIDILTPKYARKGFIQNAYEDFFSKLPLMGQNIISKSKSLKSYSIYLVHQYCDSILMHFYMISVYVYLFPVSKSLRELHRLFPENELLFDCEKSYGLELAPFSLELSMQLSNMEDLRFNIDSTLLKIPSTETISTIVKRAQRDNKGKSQINYNFNESEPENLIKAHLKLRSNNPTYKAPICKTLMGILLIRNVINLELAIESTHVAGKYWLQVVNELYMNSMLWHTTSKNTIMPNKDIEVIIGEKKMKQKKFVSVEFILRTISKRIKVMDFSLYKTCEQKIDSILDYFHKYYNVLLISYNSASICTSLKLY